ncbi:MAG: DUF5050 domain-containing protein [Opitutae bacterium]|nr:DUF5050 domain-containing protein [Opitutae bacterium]
MRFIGGLIVFCLAALAYHWCAGEIAIQLWGRDARATIYSVKRQSTRGGYTAHYEFVTEDMSKGFGSCPSHRGAEGRGVTVRYLRHDPAWNTAPIWWYAGFWMFFTGVLAWPLALWSSRIFLYSRPHRFGETEEDEDEDEEEEEEDKESETESAKTEDEEEAKPEKPAAEVLPVPFRNTWKAAMLFSLALAGAGIALNLAWFFAREQSHVAAAAQPLSAMDTPAGPAAPRGASAGNTVNGSALGFDGDAFYTGLWRNYNDAAAPAPGLYRFALDGAGRTPVGAPGETENIYRGVQVLGDWVYYLAMDGIHRIRKDGSKHRRISDSRAASLTVMGEWIYFQHSVLDGAIYRLRLDGGSEKALGREAVGAMCVADDGWIYYANKTDRGRLWRMRYDGSARAQLADRRANLLLVVGDAIWFSDPDRNAALCRLARNGTGGETVLADPVLALNWADGWLYVVRGSGELVRCRPDGTALQVLAPDAVGVLVHGSQLYVQRDIEGKTYLRMNCDGTAAAPLRF